MLVHLFECTMSPEAGVTETLLYCTGPGYYGEGAPGYYEPRIDADLPRFTAKIAGNLQTFGQSEIGKGNFKVINTDRALDRLSSCGFGRSARHLIVDQDAPYNQAKVVTSGIVDQISWDAVYVIFRFRDVQQKLTLPIQPSKFLGTNTGGAGYEGTFEDIGGQVKPQLWGKKRNIRPKRINVGLPYPLYAFNYDKEGNRRACASIEEARDAAAVLTPGVDHPTLAALVAATPTNDYDTCLAESLIMTDEELQGDLTIDASMSRYKAGQVIEDMLLDSGIPSSEIDGVSFAQFRIDADYTVGLYVEEEKSYLDAIDEIAKTGAGNYFPDQNNIYRIFQLGNPATKTPVATFKRFGITEFAEATDGDLISIRRVAIADPGEGIPCNRTILKYAENPTVQSKSEMATSVTADIQEKYAQQWMTEYHPKPDDVPGMALQAATISKYPLSPQLEFEAGALTEQADAIIENARRFTFYNMQLEMYQVEAFLTPSLAETITLGSIVRLKLPIYGLDEGKNFVITQNDLSAVSDGDDGEISIVKYTMVG